jgi:hypothetical protein
MGLTLAILSLTHEPSDFWDIAAFRVLIPMAL